MLVDRSVAVFLAIALSAAPTRAQTPAASRLTTRPADSLSAPSAAERFRDIARELTYSKTTTGPQIDQAVILLTAARSLDRTAADIDPLLLRLATRHPDKDYSDHVLLWLQSYVTEAADRVVVLDAIRYLLDRLNSNEQRQAMLETLVKRIGNKNAAIDSEIAAQLGLSMLEKGDKDAAKFYLLQAYANNKYNKVAFAKLAELAPNEIGAAAYLEHLRLVLRENPLNINAAAGFAQYVEQLQLYDLAASSYQYCADLFRYLYPSEPLPPHIYLPWALSCYNSMQSQQVCLQIAESVRGEGRFDVVLEAIAGKAAAKTGKPQEAERIFNQVEQGVKPLLEAGAIPSQPAQQAAGSAARQVNAKQVAWFYCFADVEPEKAVLWANRAFAVEPNSPSAGALLAYALSMSNELEWAKSPLASSERSQIADLVQARVQLSAGDKAGAIQTLKAAVAKDAGSLAAEKARDMLRELGSEYVSPVDTNALMAFLVQNFGRTPAPQFLPPDKIIEVQLAMRGVDFSYGNELDGVITVLNRGTEPLVLTADGLFQGGFRIDAKVGGSVQKPIPDLLSQTVRTMLTIAPGKSLSHTVRLSIGDLRRVLVTYPQASLDVEFALYLDPVVGQDGAITNRLVDVKPVTITVKRPSVEITRSYVQNRFNIISSGQEGQKIQTARLFTGLLREQHAMAEHGTLYPYRYADWLPGLLRSSLVSPSGLLLGEGRDDWVVKVDTMADLLSMPLDPELATVIAKNLNHPQWPVRLMAVYLLASNPGDSFHAVLDWVAQRDANELVRSIAMSLQSSSGPAALPGSPAGELRIERP